MRETKESLNGIWYTVYQEFDGRQVPKAEFEDQQLVLNENTYTLLAAKGDEGFINVNGRNLDIYGTDGENKGRHYSAIYRIDNDRLEICYNLTGGSYPADFRTEGKPQHFLCIFERSL